MALGKLSRYARQFAALRWLPGNTSASVLLVDLNSDLLRSCMPADASTLEVPMRGELWYVNAKSFVYLLVFLWRYRRNGQVGMRGCYTGAIARAVGARVIVTFIDNNNWDIGLREAFGIRVINVQNGLRAIDEWRQKKFDVLLLMHDIDANWRHQYGLRANETQTVGSLRLGLYLRDGSGVLSTADTKGDLLYVSQYRPGMEDADRNSLLGAVDECQQTLCGLLANYAHQRGRSVRIARSGAGRRDWAHKEEEYFAALFGDAAQFGAVKTSDPWSSYREVAAAEVVIGLCSTLLAESLAMKKKTLLCLAVCNDLVVGTWDYGVRSGYLLTLFLKTMTFPALAKALDRLTTMEDREYWESIRHEVAYFCAPVGGRLTPDLIRDRIGMLLSGLEGRDESQR